MYQIVRLARAYIDLKAGKDIWEVFYETEICFSILRTLKKINLLTELDRRVKSIRKTENTLRAEKKALMKIRAELIKD